MSRHLRWMGIDRPQSALGSELLALGYKLNAAQRHSLGIDPDSRQSRARTAAIDLLEHGWVHVRSDMVIDTCDQLKDIIVRVDEMTGGMARIEVVR
jgi:hypothetical protein